MTALVEAPVKDAPVPAAGAGPARSRVAAAVTPWRLFALFAAVAALFFEGVKPLVDIDLYWHLLVGQEILATRSLDGLGRSWAYSMPESSWYTTQWLSEVVLAVVHDVAGWRGIGLLRFAVAVVVLVGLGLLLLRGRRTPWAPIVFTLTVLPVAAVFQERPLLASLVLTVWLAAVCRRALVDDVEPRLLSVFLVTWVWANFHGQWVVVPFALGLLALGQFVQWLVDGRHGRPRWRVAAAAIGATAAGAATPVGPKLVLAPLVFKDAARQITEWQPTTLKMFTLPFVALALLTVLAWARQGVRVAVPEVCYVLGLLVFAALAVRNVPPAVMLLAPVALTRLQSAFPHSDQVTSAGERRALCGVAGLVLAVAAVALPVKFVGIDHLALTTPVQAAQRLAAQPGEHFVLNSYDAAGVLAYWGGSRTYLAIDGRTDRYGAERIKAYEDMMHMRGDWRELFDELRPNYALPLKTSPLVDELRMQGWREELRDGEFVLLSAPGLQRTPALPHP